MKHILRIIAVVAVIGVCGNFYESAQGSITFVSTLAAPSGGSMPVASNSWLAQGFYTGDNTLGYLLESVDLRMATAAGNPNMFKLFLYDAVGIFPGNPVGQLSGPLNPVDSGDFTFTASQLTLAPSTAYYVVATASQHLSDGAYKWIQPAPSANPPYEMVGGWRFGNAASTLNGYSWERIGGVGIFQFEVNATSIPEPSSLALCLCSGGLWLAARVRRRNGCAGKRTVPQVA